MFKNILGSIFSYTVHAMARLLRVFVAKKIEEEKRRTVKDIFHHRNRMGRLRQAIPRLGPFEVSRIISTSERWKRTRSLS